MKTTLIMHNMILENERGQQFHMFIGVWGEELG
jgi:hypothetical protein